MRAVLAPWLLLISGVAKAAPGELLAVAELGAASVDLGDHVAVGGELSVGYGLLEGITLFAYGGVFPVISSELMLTSGGGLTVAIDVLRTVPFVEVAGGVALRGGRTSGTFRAGLGADYFVTPELCVGLILRYHPISSEGELLSGHARLSYRIEL